MICIFRFVATYRHEREHNLLSRNEMLLWESLMLQHPIHAKCSRPALASSASCNFSIDARALEGNYLERLALLLHRTPADEEPDLAELLEPSIGDLSHSLLIRRNR